MFNVTFSKFNLALCKKNYEQKWVSDDEPSNISLFISSTNDVAIAAETQIIRYTWQAWGHFWRGLRVCSGLSDKANGVVLLLASCWRFTMKPHVCYSVFSLELGYHRQVLWKKKTTTAQPYAHKMTWLTPLGTDAWLDILCSSIFDSNRYLPLKLQRTDRSTANNIHF